MSEDEVVHLDGDDKPPSTWRDATLSLVVLLLQLHTPLHESSPILQHDLNVMANQDRLVRGSRHCRLPGEYSFVLSVAETFAACFLFHLSQSNKQHPTACSTVQHVLLVYPVD